MNLTKIKRELAKKGVGNPLDALLYDSEEIEEMKKSGEIITHYEPKVRKIRSEEYLKGYRTGHQVGKYRSRRGTIIKVDPRVDLIVEIWNKWNIKEIDGNKFGYEFYKIFKKECRAVFKLK